MNDQLLWMVTAGVALAFAGTALRVALRGYRENGALHMPHARPGGWYGSYAGDWHAAHPRSSELGTSAPGGWYAHEGVDAWGSSTLPWDKEWFRARRMSLPKRCFHVDSTVAGMRPGESALGAPPPVEEG